MLIYDTLEALEDVTFEWRLHAPVEMMVNGQEDIRVVNGAAAARAAFLWPKNLTVTQTDQFDTPPRPRIKLVEYHLTAATKEKSDHATFVTVLRPHRSTAVIEGESRIEENGEEYKVKVPLRDGVVMFRLAGDEIEAEVKSRQGSVLGSFKRTGR